MTDNRHFSTPSPLLSDSSSETTFVPALTRRGLLRAGVSISAVAAFGGLDLLGARQALAAVARPTISSCATWGAQDARGTISINNYRPTKILIHHTATANSTDYSQAHAFSPVTQHPAVPLQQWVDRHRTALHGEPRRVHHRGPAPHGGDLVGWLDVRAGSPLHRPELVRLGHRERRHVHVDHSPVRAVEQARRPVRVPVPDVLHLVIGVVRPPRLPGHAVPG